MNNFGGGPHGGNGGPPSGGGGYPFGPSGGPNHGPGGGPNHGGGPQPSNNAALFPPEDRNRGHVHRRITSLGYVGANENLNPGMDPELLPGLVYNDLMFRSNNGGFYLGNNAEAMHEYISSRVER